MESYVVAELAEKIGGVVVRVNSLFGTPSGWVEAEGCRCTDPAGIEVTVLVPVAEERERVKTYTPAVRAYVYTLAGMEAARQRGWIAGLGYHWKPDSPEARAEKIEIMAVEEAARKGDEDERN